MNKDKADSAWMSEAPSETLGYTQNGIQEIVGLVKDSGVVSGYQLSNGNIITKEQGIDLAKQGKIKGVQISSRNGREYLKSQPDNNEKNNLGSLPTV